MMPEPEDWVWQRGDTWDGNTGVRRHKRGRGRAGRRRPGRGLLLLTMALVLATLGAVSATAPDHHGPNTAVGLPRVPSPGQHPDGTPADLAPTDPPPTDPAPTDPPPTTSVSTGPMPVATAQSSRTRPGSAQSPANAQAPAKTTGPVPGPTATASATPAFAPIGVEAEDPDNLISGGARVVECGPCAGGRRVGYIGAGARVVVVANLFSAGTRTVTVTYETDGLRHLKVSANGTEVDVRWLNGTGWEAPQAFQFTAVLAAGSLHLAFYNDESPAPDIDKVVIR